MLIFLSIWNGVAKENTSHSVQYEFLKKIFFLMSQVMLRTDTETYSNLMENFKVFCIFIC